MHLRLHVGLPLGELYFQMPCERVHHELFQGFARFNLLSMLLVFNYLLFIFNVSEQCSVLVLPAFVYDASLLFKNLQGAEIDPSRKSLLQNPLVPMNHFLLEVLPLKVPRRVSVPSPVIEILIENFSLKVCQVLEGLSFLVLDTLPLQI